MCVCVCGSVYRPVHSFKRDLGPECVQCVHMCVCARARDVRPEGFHIIMWGVRAYMCVWVVHVCVSAAGRVGGHARARGCLCVSLVCVVCVCSLCA